MMARPRIDHLEWDDWNLEHITKHAVTPTEIAEVIDGVSIFRAGYKQRLAITGPTSPGRWPESGWRSACARKRKPGRPRARPRRPVPLPEAPAARRYAEAREGLADRDPPVPHAPSAGWSSRAGATSWSPAGRGERSP